jgi:hypothetical protein
MGGAQPHLQRHQRVASDRRAVEVDVGPLGRARLQRTAHRIRYRCLAIGPGQPCARTVGGLQILSGAIFPLWRLFGEASLTAHLVRVVIGIVTWLGSMGFGAAAFGRRFRLYSLVSLAVVTFNALAIAYAPEVDAGEPTPLIGLYERIAFSAYFLWLSVLAVALWRRRSVAHVGPDLPAFDVAPTPSSWNPSSYWPQPRY